SAALQPSAAVSAVWVRQLKSLDGKEFIGNAFQVKGVLANAVDDLKEAMRSEAGWQVRYCLGLAL
ncbi:unnamed protein product, partial [Effrenium voratum]